MKETIFIKKYKDKWKDLEEYLKKRSPGFRRDDTDPDYLSSLYIQLTDDLSYAKTHYPDSKVTIYLNQISSKLHAEIYKNKKEKTRRFITFWTDELPLTIYKKRWTVLVSFTAFLISLAIGWISATNDDGFVRLVLGDGYVDYTQENIDKGDPLGIYGQGSALDSSLMLMTHNIRVCIIYFTLGIFFGIGSLWAIFMNGIRIGSFLFMFYTQGLLGESMIALWMHGTFEITILIFSSASGMVLGSSFMLTGTYTRAESVKRGAKEALKMLFGVVPFLIIAGLIEGSLTRYYQNQALGISVIILSLGLVISYFVIYPYIVGRRLKKYTVEGLQYGYKYPEYRIKILVGSLWVAGGIIASLVSYAASSGMIALFYGAIIVGLIQILLGLKDWKKNKKTEIIT